VGDEEGGCTTTSKGTGDSIWIQVFGFSNGSKSTREIGLQLPGSLENVTSRLVYYSLPSMLATAVAASFGVER
jgi:hypothetical protein